MKIPILYEDKNLLVINKPAGLIVHPDGKKKEKSLVDWILKKYPRTKNVGEPLIIERPNKEDIKILRPGIVHRIDRDTSGCLLIAKNKDTYEFLKNQFQERKVHKIYNAFVYGDLKEDRGMINRPIGRSPSDFRKWSATRGARGEMREALTYFRVLKKKNGVSFVEAMPKTGRTHQIRVHFSAINHPVLKDELYAGEFFLKQKEQMKFKRMALHAKSIEFETPEGKMLKVESPFPEDFEIAIKKISK